MQAVEKTVQVADVREDVVHVDHVGLLATGRQIERQVAIEEFAQRGHTVIAVRRFGGADAGFDAQHRNAGLLIRLQAVSVLAAHVDDQAGGRSFCDAST